MSEPEPYHILALPPELREKIWLYVLAEPEPIPAYVEDCTVRRRRDVESAESQKYQGPMLQTTRLTRPLPGLPSLVLVVAQIFREAMPIYYRENIFVFHLVEEHHRDEVQKWINMLQLEIEDRQERLASLALPKGPDHENTVREYMYSNCYQLWEHLRIRLEFGACGP